MSNSPQAPGSVASVRRTASIALGLVAFELLTFVAFLDARSWGWAYVLIFPVVFVPAFVAAIVGIAYGYQQITTGDQRRRAIGIALVVFSILTNPLLALAIIEILARDAR